MKYKGKELEQLMDEELFEILERSIKAVAACWTEIARRKLIHSFTRR